MSRKSPRVLVVALGKINKIDAYNNGLFLRNLFLERWAKESVVQIFSSGDNGDSGYFKDYYCLGPNDRVLGSWFYSTKGSDVSGVLNKSVNRNVGFVRRLWMEMKSGLLGLAVGSGLYELIFRPKLSKELLSWVGAFKPDVIFAQGYNLTFSWLPLMIQKETGAKLAVLTTDDWPTYLYSGLLGEPKAFRWFVRPFVKSAANTLFKCADIPCAFGRPMAEEYLRRYGRSFHVFDHSDDPRRFNVDSNYVRGVSESRTIVAIGTFNEFRCPLLLDANQACEILATVGVAAKIVVYSSAIHSDFVDRIMAAKFIEVRPDPGHTKLPSCLASAEILLLTEGFDANFVRAIELSVSSKSHLYMFSRRPIVVYGASQAGVVKYAKEFGWAQVLDERSPQRLADIFFNLMARDDGSKQLVERALHVAKRYHSVSVNRARFKRVISGDGEVGNV